MPFPRKLLNDHEDIVVDLRPHWWLMARPAFAVVVAVAGVVVLGPLNDYLLYALFVFAAVTVVWLMLTWLRWTTTNFVVTTERVVFRAGVLAKRGMEVPLERVNNIAFSQTATERLIGKGDLLIESGGEGGQQRFNDIPKPSRVQNEIYRQMEAASARDADRMAGRRELSIPEQIEKLDELRQRGILSQAEFDAKKAQLLDRL